MVSIIPFLLSSLILMFLSNFFISYQGCKRLVLSIYVMLMTKRPCLQSRVLGEATKKLGREKNLELEQHVKTKQAVEKGRVHAEEAENKWSQNEHNLCKALKENEILKANLKKIEIYANE